MHTILLYLLKMIGYSGALMLYYYLFLRDKQYHQYNRYYLLSAVVLSLLLPLINIPVFWSGTPSEAPLYVQTIQLTTISSISEAVSTGPSLSENSLLLIVYLVISLALLFTVANAIRRISLIRQKYTAIRLHDINFYNTEEKEAPFSFFRHIFWNKKIEPDSDRGRQVFRHELYHCRQLHSADLIFMQLVLSLVWFNPVFYIIKKELTTIHEYLADQFAIGGDDRHGYAEFIVTAALQRFPPNAVAHSFFHSSLKRRIAMILKKTTTHRFSYLERIMIIPLVAGLFFLFAFRAQTAIGEQASPLTAQIVNASSIVPQRAAIPAVTTESAGGEKSDQPAASPKATKPEIAGKGSQLSAEPGTSIRRHQPNIHKDIVTPTPNRSVGTPITVNQAAPKSRDTAIPPKIFLRRGHSGDKTLYIVNGVEKESFDLIMGEISTMQVVKGEEAVKRFGEKSRGGYSSSALRRISKGTG